MLLESPDPGIIRHAVEVHDNARREVPETPGVERCNPVTWRRALSDPVGSLAPCERPASAQDDPEGIRRREGHLRDNDRDRNDARQETGWPRDARGSPTEVGGQCDEQGAYDERAGHLP